MTEQSFRSGFVTLVGRPNVGKSTLLNALVGRKVAITSAKPQTTRTRIQGVLHLPEAQVVFIDTPGIHKPKHRLGEWMVRLAENTLSGVDAVCFLLEGGKLPGTGDRYIAEQLRHAESPVIAVLNKIDQPAEVDPALIVQAVADLFPFHAVVRTSALTGEGLDELKDLLIRLMPPGPKYFPEDMDTDQPERVFVSELIREQVLTLTRDEIPHSVAIALEEMEERKGGKLYISATIYVERESQKGIIIGKRGEMLRRIGTASRHEIESVFHTPVFLDLWVKVRDNWRNREGALRQFGYYEET